MVRGDLRRIPQQPQRLGTSPPPLSCTIAPAIAHCCCAAEFKRGGLCQRRGGVLHRLRLRLRVSRIRCRRCRRIRRSARALRARPGAAAAGYRCSPRAGRGIGLLPVQLVGAATSVGPPLMPPLPHHYDAAVVTNQVARPTQQSSRAPDPTHANLPPRHRIGQQVGKRRHHVGRKGR